MNIDDVREALFDAYQAATKDPDFCGKSSEAEVDVCYPSFWHCKDLAEFKRPRGLIVYAYGIGPSRSHYFYWSEKTCKDDKDFVWYSPDPFATAVQEIRQWKADYLASMEER